MFFMKFKPFSTVPAGTLLWGSFTAGLGFRVIGRDCLDSFGESGALKGCAAEVEVAAGWPPGRGLVAVVVCAVTGVERAAEDREKARVGGNDPLRRATR